MARLLLLALVLASAAVVALAGNPYCTENNYFWLPDGTSEPGGADWSSAGKNSKFTMGPCVGVSGIGMTETHKKTVIIIDRSGAENGYMFLPGRPKDLAYAQEVNLLTLEQRPLDVITNTFCASGQHYTDGSLLSIGGDWSPDYATPGEFSIRVFEPCVDKTCGFQLSMDLARSRWYPTTALLGDGRVIIVGGSSKGVGLNSPGANVPYIEYYPRKDGVDGVMVDWLNEVLPYNLYPFVHVLPSGKVFVFASHKWMLWDTVANAILPGKYPAIDAKDAKGLPLRFSYPVAGTSAMFPLTSANGYKAEIMICGGSSTGAIHWLALPNDANPGGKVFDSDVYPTHNKCFMIQPEAPAPAWVEEEMKLPRVMPVGVLLPDGHMLVVSGTGTGHSGLGQLAHKPSLTPEMFDTTAKKWFAEPLATSKIPRSYHSSAVLAHDGSVLITGSNPNSNVVAGGGDFPSEFRTEYFHPPYMMPGVVRPVLVQSPEAVAYGAKFVISFKYTGVAKKVQVVMAQPGYSTHSFNHGMRNVVLDVVAMKAAGAVHVATVAVPANKNLLPPTWYWLFVVVNGSPNGEGKHCFVKDPAKPAVKPFIQPPAKKA